MTGTGPLDGVTLVNWAVTQGLTSSLGHSGYPGLPEEQPRSYGLERMSPGAGAPQQSSGSQPGLVRLLVSPVHPLFSPPSPAREFPHGVTLVLTLASTFFSLTRRF